MKQRERYIPLSHKHLFIEGVKYTDGMFEFDFKHDDVKDIINLTEQGLYESKVFDNTFYFGYEFNDHTDGKVRTEFLKAIKFDYPTISVKDHDKFLIDAINKLDKLISIPKYSAFVLPESKSNLNRKIFIEASKRTDMEIIHFELIKELPANISFDYAKFMEAELNKTKADGSQYHSDRAKQMILDGIKETMEMIKTLDYFSISRNFKRPNKYRQYINNFLKFRTEDEKEAYKAITNSNILILDDISTSGATLYQIIKTLRTLNDTNKLVLFTLIGKDFSEIEGGV